MSRLLNHFFRGLVFIVPFAVTIYVCVGIFRTIDGWLGLPLPGAGFLATIILITAVGFLASNLITRSLLSALERVFNKLPLVRLLYSSTRDLLNAFVGEKRRFDKPVLVDVFGGGSTKVFGFLTQESLAGLGFGDHVTVYIPQSYGFAGNLFVFPAAQITRLEADSADVMAFIISGGVTALPHGVAPARPPLA
jgi:uncharacterized membrane protein